MTTSFTHREQFISLHSSPILENLSQFFLQRFVQPGTTTTTAVATRSATKSKQQQEEEGETAAPSYSLAEIEAKKREMLFRQVPAKGQLDLSVVRDSVYFFS